LLIERFGAVCDDPMVELIKSRKTTSIEKYHEDFDAIITRLQLLEEHTELFFGRIKERHSNVGEDVSNRFC